MTQSIFSRFEVLKVIATALATAYCLLATPAHGTLLGRNITGQAVAGSHVSAVFLYDTALNITWLRDANASATAGNTNDPFANGYGGSMVWSEATEWASNLTFGTFSGWRLPTMVNTGAPACQFSYAGGTDCGFNVQTDTSEMAHLYYVTLGNKAYCPPGDLVCAGGPQAGWGLTNTGDFQNLHPVYYWSDLSFGTGVGDFAWSFILGSGSQDYYPTGNQFHAMAVRAGDVLDIDDGETVPEPGSLALSVAALIGLSVIRRRRPFSVRRF